MTTSPEALREAVERVADFATEPNTVLFDRQVPHLKADLRTLLSALQEAREALGPFAALVRAGGVDAGDYLIAGTMGPAYPTAIWSSDFRRAAEVYRALSPGGARDE